jgi:hypothetical protein
LGAPHRLSNTDTYSKHFPKFQKQALALQVNFLPYGLIADLWYSLNVSFTLNPQHRDEQAYKTQLAQVADRKPRILLVNTGSNEELFSSNEGLFSAAFNRSISGGAASLQGSCKKMDELSRRLAELPKQTGQFYYPVLGAGCRVWTV